MRKLSTTNIELAVWIGRLGSFTAAAERMHTTQPAVSARVKELEDTLGHQLFVRQGRGVELTPEGREFVEKAENVLSQLDELSVLFSKSRMAGVVRLGASSICLDLLAAMSIATARSMPLVSYHVEIERAAPLLDRVDARKLDLAIVSGPIESHKFRSRSLGFDRMLWVMSPRVNGERRNLPQSERLRGAPIWCVHTDSFYWGPATTGLRAQGADLERVNAVGNTMAVARVVAGGAGIGLVSEFLVRDELAAGRLLPVPDLPRCETIEFSVVAAIDNSSSVVGEVMAAAVAASPFARTPPDA
jgi:DNA-binding transcriptional LysR family regulator